MDVTIDQKTDQFSKKDYLKRDKKNKKNNIYFFSWYWVRLPSSFSSNKGTCLGTV